MSEQLQNEGLEERFDMARASLVGTRRGIAGGGISAPDKTGASNISRLK